LPIESPDRRTQYAFPPLPVPPVLAPAKASLPVRILLAHRDRKSHWASFVARRLLSHWRLLYRLSELAPGLTRQDSAIRFTLGRIDRVFTFDARYAVYRPFYLYPVYEPELFLLLQHLAPQIDRFFDVGASVGMHSHCLAANPDFHGRIDCFEPEPRTAEMLADLAGQLGTDERIAIHRLGLSDRTGSVQFESPAATNDTSVVRVATGSKPGHGFEADVSRLDDLGMPPPTAIKIDVEGHELQVIEGAEDTIRQGRPFIVFESIYESDGTEAIVSRLRERGYALFFLELAGDGPGEPRLDLDPAWRSVRLVLNPYSTELRRARRRTLNLFACPAERFSQLRLEPFRASPETSASAH